VSESTLHKPLSVAEGGETIRWHVIESDGYRMSTHFLESDAQEIVRAVNSHDALVEALDAIERETFRAWVGLARPVVMLQALANHPVRDVLAEIQLIMDGLYGASEKALAALTKAKEE